MGESQSRLLKAAGMDSDDIKAEIERRKHLQMLQHHMNMMRLVHMLKELDSAVSLAEGGDTSGSGSSGLGFLGLLDSSTPGTLKEVEVCGVKYKLLRLLGRGGFSKVYECLDPDNKRRALKCVDYDGTEPEILKSYEMEVRILMGLEKSHRVIQVFGAEYRAEDRMLYAVMERGETDLEEYFRRGRIDKIKRKFYWKEMLEAVSHLHQKGIVHADLKPSNFVLVEGTLKLIDLGLARLISPKKTSVTCDTAAGTVDFISPEAFLERSEDDKIKIGTFSDVWSLGCILYALLYERTPFEHLPIIPLKLRAIADPNFEINYKPVPVDDVPVVDCIKKCLKHDFSKRATIPELLNHQYLNSSSRMKITSELISVALTP